MKIIGHRGAAGYELENTLASMQIALELGVAGIEFDIRKTRDGHLVVCHDADLLRVAGDAHKISDLTLRQLQKIPLHSGANVPTLNEALELVGNKPVYIEIKEVGSVDPLLGTLQKFPNANPTILSFMLDRLAATRAKDPKIKLYGSEKTRPLEVIHSAKNLKLNGVCLNYWLLNPLTYWLCKHYKLDLMVYTVNKRWLVWFLGKLYPNILICTDYPEQFVRKNRRFVQKTV
jgi:glycerophosphoryl diester phosphodiesterase